MTITLTDEYLKRQQALAVPGAVWSKERRAYILPEPTPRAAAVALRLFPTLAAEHPELIELRAALGQEIRPFDYADKYSRPIAKDTLPAVTLYDFQATDCGYAAAVLGQHGGAYLGWERGLGKTIGAAAIIANFAFRRVLVVCPNTAKRAVWEPEIRKLLPDYEVVVLRNTAAQRTKDLGYVRQLNQAGLSYVLVVHYESLAIIDKDWKKLGVWDLVIADECHRISNPKTQMAKALKRVPASRKLALSGSIISNHAEELFSQLQWLYPDRYRSKWRDWNDRYLDFVDSGYSKVCVGVKIERLAEMRDELGRFMTYRRKEDELDLPDRTEETRLVELSPAQARAYRDLQETCLTQLDDDSIVKAQDGLVLLTRLRQVATGLDLVSGELADSSKQDLAIELIEDNQDEAFVVFSWYKAAAYSLADRLNAKAIDSFVVTGDTKPVDRATAIEAFQGGVGRVFIGTLSTLGESVTLHRASNAVFLDRSWNPATNAQAADRIYRIGQTKPVTVTHIVAKNTVDELRVLPVIQDKDQLRRLILGG